VLEHTLVVPAHSVEEDVAAELGPYGGTGGGRRASERARTKRDIGTQPATHPWSSQDEAGQTASTETEVEKEEAPGF
jgi:hypothetical protein